MKNRVFSLLCLVGAAFSLGGCQTVTNPGGAGGTKPATTKHDAATTVTEADTGKTINLHMGDTFTVRLESNPSTGYGWRTKERKGDSLVTVGKQPEYLPDPVAPGVVGAGGHAMFHFAVKKPGREKLGFVYVRPQKPGEVAKQVRYEVVVQ